MRPKQVQREHNVLEVKLPLIFQILLIQLVVLTLLLVLLSLVYEAIGVQLQHHGQVWAYFEGKPFILLFITLILLAPIQEEIVFRLPLLYSGGFLLTALAVFAFHYGPVIATAAGMVLPQALLFLAILIGAVVLFIKKPTWRAKLKQLWQHHFGLVFYFFTLLFAVMHLLNYSYLELPAYLLPMLVLPQLIGGIFLGYTRLRLGLSWAIGQHMFNNALILFLIYGYFA